MHYVTRRHTVEALQFTGLDSLPALQAFLAPMSPSFNPFGGDYNGQKGTCGIHVRNRESEAQYPTLGPQYKTVPVAVGGWVLKHDVNDFTVVPTDVQFQTQYELVPDGLDVPRLALDTPIAVEANVEASMPDVEPPAAPDTSPEPAPSMAEAAERAADDDEIPL